MRISVGQSGPGGGFEENLATMGRLVARAADDGAALVVLPEESMLAARFLPAADFPAAVAAAWEPFVTGVRGLAREHGVAVVAGGYEPGPAGRPYNTLVAAEADGSLVGTYRKLHLYDAFDHRESDLITAGDGGAVVLELAGLRVGLQTCYDLRFPEVSRALALAGADVLAIPAAWFAGEHKVDHWRTLLRARAIENTVWVAAADCASDATVGRSVILDPLGLAAAELGEEPEAVVTVEVDRERTSQVRRVVPVLANRRSDVFTG